MATSKGLSCSVPNELYLLYVNDGMGVAESIFKRFQKFNIVVHRLNLTDDGTSKVDLTSQYLVAILATPGMIKFKRLLDTNVSKNIVDQAVDVTMLSKDISTEECRAIENIFKDNELKALNVGTTSESFRLCLAMLMCFFDDDCTLKPVLKKFMFAPKKNVFPKNKVFIIVDQELLKDEVALIVEFENGERVTATRIQQTVFAFSPPELYDVEIEVKVYCADELLGVDTLHFISKMKLLTNLLHDVSNPIEVMAQALNSTDSENLDDDLVDIFHQNNQLENVSGYLNTQVDKQSNEELPSLLHFGAKYGFIKLCQAILQSCIGHMLVNLKNRDGLTPSQIALNYSHQKIAHLIHQHTEPSHKVDTPEPVYVEMGINLVVPKEIGRSLSTGDMYINRPLPKPPVFRSVSSNTSKQQTFDDTYVVPLLQRSEPVIRRLSPPHSDVQEDVFKNFDVVNPTFLNIDARPRSDDSGLGSNCDSFGGHNTEVLGNRISEQSWHLRIASGKRASRIWNDCNIKLPENQDSNDTHL
ncbi:uncharacterized protein LOC126811649 isoform X2 [Patella vulgata]|uniref:uncharacterized protein LOC126811649 isoform X2 n=1 Tax=Patella vulgata TaxID=6465 RepID=UPI00217F9043|nr:uncharacterized protein LOC126811649 isoform X2 [Patella vulgata]